ncbi:MAG: hypothetical protein ACKN85_17570, partial [Pirellula sp.]
RILTRIEGKARAKPVRLTQPFDLGAKKVLGLLPSIALLMTQVGYNLIASEHSCNTLYRLGSPRRTS